MMGLLVLCWFTLSTVPAEASCRTIDPSCRNGSTAMVDVTMLQSPQDWDGPMRSIYQGYLVPVFAACDCPLFGIEEVESWLSRVAAGRYGLCLACNGQVEPDWLHSFPEAEFCSTCYRIRERMGAG